MKTKSKWGLFLVFGVQPKTVSLNRTLKSLIWRVARWEMGIMGSMGKRHKTKTSPAHGRLSGLLCWPHGRKTETAPAQPDSIMSNLGAGKHGYTEGAKHTKKAIFTKNVKNIMDCFMGEWENEPMSKMQNDSPQQYSRMSNLKMETENTLPQRYSKMSNERLSVLSCRPHGQNGMFTMRIKNIADCYGGIFLFPGLIFGLPEVTF